MMPLLVLLTLVVAIYTMFMPNAWDGVVYYLKPDFSKFSATTVLAAMGQLFYSMSIAMGIMITYGSYMKKDVNLESSVHQIEIFDTGIAFLAGMMIIPSVFAFSGGDEAALGKGPGLMFITLPKVFDSMPGGTIIGAAFFLLVLFAALTSAISLMETIVSIFEDKLNLGRKKTCLLVLAGAFLLGVPSSLGFGVLGNVSVLGLSILDMFDFVSNSVLMPIVAFLTCIFIGYVLKPQTIIDELEVSAPFKAKKLFIVIIKYVAPVFIVLILLSSVLDVLGIMKI
jgi:NSS family neurotransmitter:Na+ symporter